MPWLFAAVVLVCAILFPRFRKVLIVSAAVVGFGGVAFFLYDKKQSETHRRVEAQAAAAEEAEAETRIELDETELVAPRLQGSSGRGYSIIGRVRNHSTRHTLSDFTMRVTIEDCAGQNGCDTVFSGDESPYRGLLDSWAVPPEKLATSKRPDSTPIFVQRASSG